MRYLFLVLIFQIGFSANALVSDWYTTLPEKSRFQVSEELRPRVDFWVKIYSKYSDTQGVFHLANDPNVILGEIDFTKIFENPNLSDFKKMESIKNYVKDQKEQILIKYHIRDKKLVRLQMGLGGRMKKALFISGKYMNSMEEIFKNEGLPVELTRLVFVESSFNVFAQSKVGASGLWQIMPGSARSSGYIRKNYDQRNHPYYATLLAAKILKTNYKKLKSWPLAITAYNHGLSGVRRMMRKSESVSIEDMIASKEVTRSWGFASKNYYASFLAVLQVERNAKEIYGDDLVRADNLSYYEYKLKTKTKSSKILKWYDGSLTRFKQMNPHLNWAAIRRKKSVPAGVSLMIPEKNMKLVRN